MPVQVENWRVVWSANEYFVTVNDFQVCMPVSYLDVNEILLHNKIGIPRKESFLFSRVEFRTRIYQGIIFGSADLLSIN